MSTSSANWYAIGKCGGIEEVCRRLKLFGGLIECWDEPPDFSNGFKTRGKQIFEPQLVYPYREGDALNCDDVTWRDVTGSTVGSTLRFAYDDTPLVWNSFGGTNIIQNGTFTIVWNVIGIFQMGDVGDYHAGLQEAGVFEPLSNEEFRIVAHSLLSIEAELSELTVAH